MLNLYFYNYFFFLPFFTFFYFFWIFFIKNNFYTVRLQPSSNDLLKHSSLIKKINYNFFIKWSFILYIYFFLFFYFIKIDFNLFWFNHLKINNFILNVVLVIMFLSLFVLLCIKNVNNSNINYSIDYFFSIFCLIVFIPLMFFSNTLYTFIFILEVNSLLILYKFAVSKFIFKETLKNNSNYLTRRLPFYYLNMLFFQYWANFFSSILLFVSVFNFIFLFGSSEWIAFNFLNYVNYNIYYFNNLVFFFVLWVSFFIGFFLKLGFTPIHLFKIEVYKGLPFISIFFYTTIYFLSFFLFFILFVIYFVNSFKIYFYFLFFIFFITGLLYLIFLLFDINLIKSFFAYSTIVNVLSFFSILLSSL